MSVFDEQRARVYDAGARTIMPGYEALHEMAREALAGALDKQAAARLLLLGVGTGFEAEQIGQRFPRWRWTGVDPSEPMLAVARQRLGGEADLRLGVVEDFDDLVELDAIVSVGVLHHLSSREQQREWVLSLGRRMRVGGTLLIGCQVGPYAEDSLRMRSLRARWLRLGERDIDERMRLFMTHTLAPDWPLLEELYSAAGLSSPERLFSTAYFELLAASRL